jgi:sec-independent protein translocase protein TatA
VHPLLAEIFGPDLIIVIVVAAIVIFGGSRIPKLARSLGSAQSEFKKGLAEGAAGKGDQAPAQADQAPASDAGSGSGSSPAQ